MRPIQNNNEFWQRGRKGIQIFPEEIVFKLTQEESEKCRFRIINHSTGDAECYIHNGNHGVRLHPKHLWDIRDGLIYFKDQSGQWQRWLSVVKENLTRFEKEE